MHQCDNLSVKGLRYAGMHDNAALAVCRVGPCFRHQILSIVTRYI